MPTVIRSALVTPSYWLTLVVEKDTAAAEPDAWRVTVDGVDTTHTRVPDLGYDKTTGLFYLPRAVKLTPASTVEVTVTPMAAGNPTGDASAALQVTATHEASPEAVIRNLVADVLTAAALTYEEEEVWVYRNREGLPRTVVGRIGKPGPVLEVGVPYMLSEDPDANSTDTDTGIAVPIRVVVKGDNPDRGEDAVNIAYLVRGTLTEAMSLERYGVVRWNWTGSPPNEEGDKTLSVAMTMNLTRVAERGLC